MHKLFYVFYETTSTTTTSAKWIWIKMMNSLVWTKHICYHIGLFTHSRNQSLLFVTINPINFFFRPASPHPSRVLSVGGQITHVNLGSGTHSDGRKDGQLGWDVANKQKLGINWLNAIIKHSTLHDKIDRPECDGILATRHLSLNSTIRINGYCCCGRRTFQWHYLHWQSEIMALH